MSSAITIDIWSDVMCPWCVIGAHQLDRALAGLGDAVSATIRFHPFELNPDMPADGEDQAAHIMRKYGRTQAEAGAARDRIRAVAADAGYSFDYTGPGDPPPAMMWNTRAAHKLLVMALRDHGPAAQVRLKHALFDAHFQQRRNLGDPAELVAIATEAGIDADEARRALADAELESIVVAGEQQAWDWNITAVPAMVVNGQYLIPGAQDPETYARLLTRIIARDAARSDQA